MPPEAPAEETKNVADSGRTLCPVCNCRMSPLYEIRRFDPPLDIWKCAGCALQSNLTRPDNLGELYSEGYYTGEADYTYEDERKNEAANDQVWQARLKTIQKTNPAPASFLDVGCSFGGFVEAASRAGYAARGLDLSHFAVQEGRKRGRDLYCGPVDEPTFPAEDFNVITLIEVMEHLPDPARAARTFHHWLKPGGLLLIQTANFDGLQAKREGPDYHYYLPGHLFYYSAANLKRLLAVAGFRRFKLYRPVDFPLAAKLRKMKLQSAPQSPGFQRLLRTSMYHLKGRMALGDFALTSSMVLYAWK